MSEGLEVLGNVRWELALCLLLAWFVVMAVLSKGIKSLGKARPFVTIMMFAYQINVLIFQNNFTEETFLTKILDLKVGVVSFKFALF